MRRGINIMGIVAPFFFALSVIILGAVKPGYSHIYHTMSELGETGGVTAQIAATVFIVAGLMIAVFGYGVHLELRRDDKHTWTGAMIILYGLLDFVGSGVFPIEAGGSTTTLVSTIHVYATLFGELAAVGMPVWFIKDTEESMGWEPLRRFSRGIFYLSIPLIGFLGYCIVENTPGVIDVPIGLAQRLLVGVFLAWILGTAVMLWQREQYITSNRE